MYTELQLIRWSNNCVCVCV